MSNGVTVSWDGQIQTPKFETLLYKLYIDIIKRKTEKVYANPTWITRPQIISPCFEKFPYSHIYEWIIFFENLRILWHKKDWMEIISL